ncbi:branched-chain amino acid transport system substrate-binding protein [Bradyrhizobium diazoefficiens]|nr:MULTISPECIES: ABC transporter substrate-binding protein [Bradyrhizobium]MCD9825382.1 ABC transporter substrate-binding protein [Bradyrhizobium japonicum]MCD9898343.1 ABC transporter substrate-binding protein [Bradyrhizobium japonicum]MCP1748844.1 branched-chain amino acid transport system substrate-binding protein [Bradyrhizobium japonicum]MCP1866339.1 branched-chain amino acid transport system substrate-binding protein [Bradyrhizobium japonicum]MCP1898299.1 branched-chain amino acid transp
MIAFSGAQTSRFYAAIIRYLKILDIRRHQGERSIMRPSAAYVAIMAILVSAKSIAAPTLVVAQGISGDVIKIGVMNDQSGPYSDNCGLGSVIAARLAISDFGRAINGKNIELIVADDQNKPDIGVAIALRWLDNEGVDAIVGCSASSVALGVQDVMRSRKKPYLLAGTAAAFFTNERCSPLTTQWAMDTYALAKATVKSLLARRLDTWFFVTVDYSFGKVWQADATNFIKSAGGKVVGSVLHPLNSSDFASVLLTAQSSGAKVVALANSGADFANALKQAEEFGLTQKQQLAPLGLMINQTHSIGLQPLQNVGLTTTFYWDRTDETRAFAKRYEAAFDGRIPNEAQASTYSAVMHYLKAIAAAQTDEGEAVVRQMKNTPVNDFEMKNVSIRADGQVMRPLYAARIKASIESKYPYDYYEITGTIPAEDAWRPAAESTCNLLKTQ